jgi:hypothetical protein
MTTLPCAKGLFGPFAREELLLQHREAPASFYLQHSPSLRRLNHLFDKTGSDNQSQAAPIPQLAAVVENEVTSLRALWARGFAVRPNLPAWRSLETRIRVSFLGVDTTSTPLPVGKTSSLLGSVSSFPYRQSLGGTFIVELFMAVVFEPSPSVVIHPVPFVTEEELPTPDSVERT